MWVAIHSAITKVFANFEKESLRDLLKAKLKDPKIIRYLNFRDLALVEICFQINALEKNFLNMFVDAERHGIFTAVNNTQLSDFYPYFEVCFDCVGTDGTSSKKKFDSAVFGGKVLDKINPNIAITALVNNGLAQASREFEIRGSSSCFYDPFIGSSHALKQAYQKLKASSLDKAWVVASEEGRDPFDLCATNGMCSVQTSAISVSRLSEEVPSEGCLKVKFLRSIYLPEGNAKIETSLKNMISNFRADGAIVTEVDSVLVFSNDFILNQKVSSVVKGQVSQKFLDRMFSNPRFEFLSFIAELSEENFNGRLLVMLLDEYGLIHSWMFMKM